MPVPRIGRPAQRPFRFGVLLATIALALPFASVPADAQPDNKQVLVLYSTRRDAQLSIVGEQELPRSLQSGYPGHVDYYSEFMDLRMFPEPTNSAFRDFLTLKYRGVHFDLVVAVQDAALEFVSAHRGELFIDTPLIYLTNNPATMRRRNSAGLVHPRDFASTVTFLRQLQPDVRNLFVVTGASSGDRAYEREARRQLAAATSGLNVTYLAGLTSADLDSRLARLPARSAVYYIVFSEDGAGQKFHPLEFVDRIAATANSPTYSWVDSVIGHGVVGGSLYLQADVIKRLAELALRVLRGEGADGIPLATLRSNTNVVDWRQLRRWSIADFQIPPGTIVNFREESIWTRYGRYVLLALALLITQSVLIAGLLIQGRRRRRAEAALQRRERALTTSHSRIRDLGSRLLRAQESERARIARELHDDICQRMLLLTLELESLKQETPHHGQAAQALGVARDVAKSLHELSHQLHPTSLRLIGLVNATERLCAELSRAGTTIAFTHQDMPMTIPPDVMLCVFRVIQEALQNAIKHSKATQVMVHLQGAADGINAIVADNGIGFDMEAVGGAGVGLPGMNERLEALDGSLDVRSAPGSGTRIAATIPAKVIQRRQTVVETT